MTSIAGIILAAGAGERMGRVKQLLPYQGIPLLQHAVNAAVASELDSVVVVTGAFGDEVDAALILDRATVVRNPDYRRGNMSSLECGAAQVPNAEAVVLLMGDHPDLGEDVINQMISLWRDTRPWGGVTSYRDRIAHPFLLSRPALEEAVATGGPKLLWRMLVADDTGRVMRLSVEDSAPIDVNTPDDYQRLLGPTTET